MAATPKLGGPVPAQETKRILVADDEKHIVRMIEVYLRRGGHTVESAPDGRKALDMVLAEKYDLIILDLTMPIMDGFEVIKTLRATEQTKEIPIIVITAQANDTAVAKAYQLGADLVLPKPFNPTDLTLLIDRF